MKTKITEISFPSPADLLAFISGKNQDEVVDVCSISNCLLSQYFHQTHLGFDYSAQTFIRSVWINGNEIEIPKWFQTIYEESIEEYLKRNPGKSVYDSVWITFRDLAAKITAQT